MTAVAAAGVPDEIQLVLIVRVNVNLDDSVIGTAIASQEVSNNLPGEVARRPGPRELPKMFS